MTFARLYEVSDIGDDRTPGEATRIVSRQPRSTLRPTSRGKIIGNDPRIVRTLETIDR